MVEAEIAYGTGDFAFFDEVQAVAGHAGHDFFIRIDFADVPNAGNKQAAIRAGNHFFDCGVAATEDQIHGRFAIFVGKGKTVASRLLAGLFCTGTGIDEIAGHAVLDQWNALTRNAFTIEGCTRLLRMIDIIGNRNVLAEERFADAIYEARTLIRNGRGSEIVEKKTNQIENGGVFENYGVLSRREFLSIFGETGFFAGANGKFLRIECCYGTGVGFGPTGGRFVLHGDGKFGMSLAVSGKKPARIAERELRLSRGKNSGGGLAVANCEIA